jgi:cell division protein FtsI (penicillin-binding protein 3)
LRPRAQKIGNAVLARVARKRLSALSIVILLVFATLTVRLVQLQAVSGAHYEKLALQQRLDTITVPAQRGSIFDRHGRDLALSVPAPTIWANPQVVGDPKYYAAKLAPIVGVPEQTLADRLALDKQFVYVARRVGDDVVAKVRALQLPGVAFTEEPARQYPSAGLAGPIIGHVNGEGTGQSGLEALYDQALKGKPGELEAERDARGREIPRTVRKDIPAQRGTDIVLTIDQTLQYEAERSLTDQVAATNARGGMAIVLDVHTGDVLAMANAVGAGNGQPPHPATASDLNRALTDVFEPGSTNKVITISTALEQGLISPTQTFEVPDHITIADRTYRDDHQHPVEHWTATDIIRESSNVGTIEIAQLLGKQRLDAALRAFGLGQKTAIDFGDAQASGILLPLDHYYGTGLASVPIGYGVAVTAQQMLDVYATVANGGETRPPRLVSATIDARGDQHPKRAPAGTRVISPNTAAVMTEMLTHVVSGGTGACAAIPGYTVAGKTGTSRKPLPDGHGYSDKYMASFIGFAPAEAPRVATIVVLDEPVPIYGGRVAAPVFAEVTGQALQMLRVAPPDPNSTQFADAQATARADGSDCLVRHGAPLAEYIQAKQVAAQKAAAAKAKADAAAASAAVAATNQAAKPPTSTVPATSASTP